MPRATIIIKTDDPDEVTACDAWFERWDSSLTRKSDNYGCGCCVDIYDVEGPQEAIDALPAAIRTSGEWVESGREFGGRGEIPAHTPSDSPWWKIW
jgi:hypothetical protein